VAGEYNDWTISESDRARMREAMDKAATGASEPDDIGGFVEKFGKRRLAEEWARARGTKVASQMRNINRYLKGERTLKTPTMKDVVSGSARRAAGADLRAKGSVTFTMEATYVTSRKPWRGTARGTLSGAALTRFADAIESGDYERAMQIGTASYFDDPDVVLEMRNVGEMSFE